MMIVKKMPNPLVDIVYGGITIHVIRRHICPLNMYPGSSSMNWAAFGLIIWSAYPAI